MPKILKVLILILVSILLPGCETNKEIARRAAKELDEARSQSGIVGLWEDHSDLGKKDYYVFNSDGTFIGSRYVGNGDVHKIEGRWDSRTNDAGIKRYALHHYFPDVDERFYNRRFTVYGVLWPIHGLEELGLEIMFGDHGRSFRRVKKGHSKAVDSMSASAPIESP